MKKGMAAKSSGKRNGNNKGVLNRVSPLPIMSSPHPFQTKNMASASAHITEGFNVNLSLLRTPNIEPCASPAISKPTPKVSSISDLKDVASNRLESMKKDMDHTYSALLKELEASSSRLAKRLKLQTQSSMQRAEETDRDYKKLCGRLNEDFEEIQATFTELIAEAQSSGSRLCKTSLPEILNSAEKSLEGLRSRYAH